MVSMDGHRRNPSAYWPVGTSAIYSVFYFLWGHTFTPIVIFNIVLSTGVVALTMWLGNAFFDHTIGIVAGAVMAVWPSQIGFVTILASELLFTFFVLLGFAVWFYPRLSNLYRALRMWIGIWCGLICASRSAAVAFRTLAISNAPQLAKLLAAIARIGPHHCRYCSSGGAVVSAKYQSLWPLRTAIDKWWRQFLDGQQSKFERFLRAATGVGGGAQRI